MMRAPDLRHRCPLVAQLPDRERWELGEDFRYTDDRPEGAVVIAVPRGFPFDFASIPRVLWTAVGHPTSGGTCAPLLHDELYRHGGQPPGCARRYTRAEADALFRDVLRRHGVSRRRAFAWWLGVRLGGRGAWKGRG